jgi:hypothetical protein
MIHANDLRIGNWVAFKGLWIAEVEKFTAVSITIRGNKGFFDIESFEGIELCDDVFKNAGFVHSFVNENWETYRLDRIEFSKMKDGYGYDIAKIKHLHQLQNLYYALTGQELNIQL